MLQEYNICYLRYTTRFRPRQTKKRLSCERRPACRRRGNQEIAKSRSCPAISQEIRNIPLDIIINENIIYLDTILRSDGIVWNWQRL